MRFFSVHPIILLLFLPCLALAGPAELSSVPELLHPWRDWVLHGHERQVSCTPAHDNAARLNCDWPSELSLRIDAKGGAFSQTWSIQHEQLIPLPGDPDHWPVKIMVDDQPALVVDRGGVPHVRVSPGNRTVSGEFIWTRLPEFIRIPPHSGLVDLVVDSVTVDFPDMDSEGRVWLRGRERSGVKAEDRLTLDVFRFIDDRIPLRSEILLQFDVSGAAREVLLGPVFSTQRFVPVSVQSSLPARLEPDGRLRVQVRPGRWQLSLVTRHIGPVETLAFEPPRDGFWPDEEIWVFNAHPNLRVVEVEGVAAIDPQQTSLPQRWHRYPAYRVSAGESMLFREIKRGDPHPAPDQLSLQRNVWLRFDGTGYLLQDTVAGTKSTGWRLEMNPPLRLGRVTVDGAEQFITKRKGSDKAGVELRKGKLNLVAESEYRDDISRLPAVGWDHDMQRVTTSLHLPPGWRLLTVSGVDSVRGTWVKRWTLLDFFVVLVMTMAVGKLFSRAFAGLAFVTLVLLYHEPDAPRWIWLAILICVALLRYLPDGRFKRAVKGLQLVNIVALLVIALPFAVTQLRVGIFPQLEKPWQSMDALAPVMSPQPAPALQKAPESETVEREALLGALEEKSAPGKKSLRPRYGGRAGSYDAAPSEQVAQYDPAMVNQTGPGLPAWKWNTIPLGWSGPVQRDQEITLILLGPAANLVLAFLRVGLLVLLALGMFNIRLNRREGKLRPIMTGLLLPAIFAATLLPLPSSAATGQIPSPQLLDELRERLLEPNDCFPTCADISSMDVHITSDVLRITMRVDALTDVSIPLPGEAGHWLASRITLDGEGVPALLRENGQLRMRVIKGRHEVTMEGRIPGGSSLQVSLPLRPHRVTVVQAEGWTVEGVSEDNIPGNQLHFRRVAEETSSAGRILETGTLPPFLLIERTFRIGLQWKIETRVRRISPPGPAVVFDYPLLPGESVLTEGIKVRDRKAQITLDPAQSLLVWESSLERTADITLRHAETDLWTEMWRVDVSPIFHMEPSGIPVILHQQGTRWYPTWHPWPGEEVTLRISRPEGIPGKTVTIDSVRIDNRPGRRAAETHMTIDLRSSRGGQHTITLPEGAILQEVRINGSVLPLRMDANRLTLPLKPGAQEVALLWKESKGMGIMYRTPRIDLGMDSVNTSTTVNLPGNRWPLFLGGPLMGPAVLFWSVVLVILLAAIGLARTGMTPLRLHQWFLLGIGMSQGNIPAVLLVVAWLLVLELRGRIRPDMDKTLFNLMQIGIVALTVIGISALIMAISRGLLGHPDMNIVGNGSNAAQLKWYQDTSDALLSRAWVVSIPLYFYRLAMLAWALWISFTLINVLKWGWARFTDPVPWHRIERKVRPRKRKKEKNETREASPAEPADSPSSGQEER
ncbi:MAG: hypothetical protein Kow0089_22710 [Desulfobulbaceae bacterium]